MQALLNALRAYERRAQVEAAATLAEVQRVHAAIDGAVQGAEAALRGSGGRDDPPPLSLTATLLLFEASVGARRHQLKSIAAAAGHAGRVFGESRRRREAVERHRDRSRARFEAALQRRDERDLEELNRTTGSEF
ncbi:MAG: hypothetical protein JO060_11430 [Candidatus Eremiobacteraeota bacterium]|nr:hypothetical protein [Candidatus Eremiobacteraeota bacterium]MBV9647513.1 hypothetical protein [Candidatus Eremiobacteraeota bacterium]